MEERADRIFVQDGVVLQALVDPLTKRKMQLAAADADGKQILSETIDDLRGQIGLERASNLFALAGVRDEDYVNGGPVQLQLFDIEGGAMSTKVRAELEGRAELYPRLHAMASGASVIVPAT